MNEHPVSNAFEEQVRQAVQVQDANPEFVASLRGRLASMPVKAGPRFTFRPLWAVGLALLVVAIAAASLPGVASAVRQWFGFIPGLGLVEQHSTLRSLKMPVSVERDGVTVTLQAVLVYPDRVELTYSAAGIRGGAGPGGEACGGADSYPYLSLPDGALLEPDPMPKGGKTSAMGYNMGHSYSTSIPEGVNQATFLLTCLQNTTRGTAPENWVIPFQLVDVPAGQAVGEPLAAGEQPAVARPEGSAIAFDLVGGAVEEDGYHFFFHFNLPGDDPALLAARPAAMYAIDSSGARIDVINALPWSPFDHVEVWEYRTALMPAPGPLTLVIEGAQVYYLAQEAAFTFAPGADPQMGQTWALDETFTIGGQQIRVTSARMIEMDGHPGFEFTIQAADPAVTISAEVMDMTPSAPEYSMWSTTRASAPGSSITAGFVYENAVPETLTVTFNTLAVLHDGSWTVDWTPPAP